MPYRRTATAAHPCASNRMGFGRGRFLCVLGSASLACDVLALVFGACASSQSVMQFSRALQLVDCAAAPALLAAIGLGLAACLMARRDLRLMWQGLIDPGGRPSTEWGQHLGLCRRLRLRQRLGFGRGLGLGRSS